MAVQTPATLSKYADFGTSNVEQVHMLHDQTQVAKTLMEHGITLKYVILYSVSFPIVVLAEELPANW